MQISLFREQDRLTRLDQLGDSLVRLDKAIDREGFRPVLEEATDRREQGKVGRPPFDAVMMFKILVLQRLYNLSDD